LMSSTSSWPCSKFCAVCNLKIRKCSSIVLRKYRSVCVGCRKILRTEILILAGFLTGLLLEGDNKGKFHLESWWDSLYVRILCEFISWLYITVKWCLYCADRVC
jgi:hypothetical protein